MLKKRTKKLFEILFYPLISILVFLIIWDIGVRNSELSVVMPGPWEVIIQLFLLLEDIQCLIICYTA